MPRYHTSHPDYMWLNRLQCMGVGVFDVAKSRVSYDISIAISLIERVVSVTACLCQLTPFTSGVCPLLRFEITQELRVC